MTAIFKVSTLTFTIATVVCMPAANADITAEDQLAELNMRNLQLQEELLNQQSSTNLRSLRALDQESTSALGVPAGCVSDPFPTNPGSPSYSLNAEWFSTPVKKSSTITIWRQPCLSNPSNAAVFFRVVPNNAPFFSSAQFNVIQNGIQYTSIRFKNTVSGYFSGAELYTPSTFLMDQYPDPPIANFNTNEAFTLVYSGAQKNSSVNISAYGQVVTPPGDAITLSLEVPVQDSTYSGISSVQGWAVSSDGIDRVELFIDGQYWTNAPYGGQRTDVRDVFPNISNSEFSGFVMAYGYTNLSAGPHTLTAKAYSKKGDVKEDSSSFIVQKFHEDFFAARDAVNVAGSQCTPEQFGALFRNMSVDGQLYNVRLQWQTATQGFEITNIE